MRIQNTPFGSTPFKRGVAIITTALFLFTGLFCYAPTAFAQSQYQSIEAKRKLGQSKLPFGERNEKFGQPNNKLKVQGGNPSKDLSRLVRDAEIRIPPELGFITEKYEVRSTVYGEKTKLKTPYAVPRTVVYIQDAHDSLEAQENISKIINHLVAHYGVKTVFEEGYEGPVPTDKYFGFIKDPKIKEKVSYFLMDHLRVGGAEYAHINRKSATNPDGSAATSGGDFNLVGADSLKLHKENVDQYRLSAAKKDTITKDLKALEKELKALVDSRFPKKLKEWLKTKKQFDGKKLDLFTYLGRTMPLVGEHGAEKGRGLISFILEAIRSNDPVVLQKAKHIDAREVFGELIKLEKAVSDTYLHDTAGKQLFEYYKILSLLNRLNELQVSQEEYEAVKVSLKAFDTDSFARFIFSQTPKTLILSRMWERNILDAIKFYEMAKKRDHSLDGVLDKYFLGDSGEGIGYRKTAVQESLSPKPYSLNPTTRTAVLVYGGFHKEAIKRILEAKGISYLVVSPRITKPSPRHEEFYKQLMTKGMYKFEVPLNLRFASRALPVFAFANGGDEVRAIDNIIERGVEPAMVERYLLNTPQGIQSVRSEVRSPLEQLAATDDKDEAVVIARGLGLDLRASQYGMLHPLHVGLLTAMHDRVISRSDSAPKIAVDGAGGVDLTTAILATGANEIYKVDSEKTFRLDHWLENWNRIEKMGNSFEGSYTANYTALKFVNGHGGSSRNGFFSKEAKLVAELKALGVRKEDVWTETEVVSKKEWIDRDNPQGERTFLRILKFRWSPTGTEADKRLYVVHFIEGDITQAETFSGRLGFLKGKVDFYYQRAGFGAARQSANYMPAVFEMLKPGAFLFVDPHYQENLGENSKVKTMDLPVVLNGANLAYQTIELGDEIEAWRVAILKYLSRQKQILTGDYGYGWDLQIFQKTERSEVRNELKKSNPSSIHLPSFESKADFARRFRLELSGEFRRSGIWKTAQEIVDHELPFAIAVLQDILRYRLWMDQAGAHARPLLILQNMRVGELYPYFTASLRKRLQIVEMTPEELIKTVQQHEIQSEVKNARYVLVKYKYPSSYTDIQIADDAFVKQLAYFSKLLRSPLLMIDSSGRQVRSNAQQSVANILYDEKWEQSYAAQEHFQKTLLANDTFYILVNRTFVNTGFYNPSWMDGTPFLDGPRNVGNVITRDLEILIGGKTKNTSSLLREIYGEAIDRYVIQHTEAFDERGLKNIPTNEAIAPKEEIESRSEVRDNEKAQFAANLNRFDKETPEGNLRQWISNFQTSHHEKSNQWCEISSLEERFNMINRMKTAFYQSWHWGTNDEMLKTAAKIYFRDRYGIELSDARRTIYTDRQILEPATYFKDQEEVVRNLLRLDRLLMAKPLIVDAIRLLGDKQFVLSFYRTIQDRAMGFYAVGVHYSDSDAYGSKDRIEVGLALYHGRDPVYLGASNRGDEYTSINGREDSFLAREFNHELAELFLIGHGRNVISRLPVERELMRQFVKKYKYDDIRVPNQGADRKKILYVFLNRIFMRRWQRITSPEHFQKFMADRSKREYAMNHSPDVIKRQFLSVYSALLPNELYAEAMSLMLLDMDFLKRNDREMYDFLQLTHDWKSLIARSEVRSDFNVNIVIDDRFHWREIPPKAEAIKTQLETQIEQTELGKRFSTALKTAGIDRLKVWMRYESLKKGGSGQYSLNWAEREIGMTIGYEDGNLLEQIIAEISKNENYQLGYHQLHDEFFKQGIIVHRDGTIHVTEVQTPRYQAILRKVAEMLGFLPDQVGPQKFLPSRALASTDSQPVPLMDSNVTLWQLLDPFAAGYGQRDGWRNFPSNPRSDGSRFLYTTSFRPSSLSLSAFGILDQLKTVEEFMNLLNIFSISTEVFRQRPIGTMVHMNTGGRSPMYGSDELVFGVRFFAEAVFPDEIAGILKDLQQSERTGKLTPEILRTKAKEIISKLMAFGVFSERFLFEISNQGLLDNRPSKYRRTSVLPFDTKTPLLEKVRWLIQGPEASNKQHRKGAGLSLVPAPAIRSLARFETSGSSWLTLLNLPKPKYAYETVTIALGVLNEWAKDQSEKPENWGIFDKVSSKRLFQFSIGSGGPGYQIGFEAQRDDTFGNGVPYRYYFIQNDIDAAKLESLFREIDKILPRKILNSQEWKDLKKAALHKVTSFRSEMRASPAEQSRFKELLEDIERQLLTVAIPEGEGKRQIRRMDEELSIEALYERSGRIAKIRIVLDPSENSARITGYTNLLVGKEGFQLLGVDEKRNAVKGVEVSQAKFRTNKKIDLTGNWPDVAKSVLDSVRAARIRLWDHLYPELAAPATQKEEVIERSSFPVPSPDALTQLYEAYDQEGWKLLPSGGAVPVGMLQLNPQILGWYRNLINDFGRKLKILSIGSGRGQLEKVLQEDGHEVTAVDLSEKNAELARTLGVKTMVADAHQPLSLKDQYDLVIIVDAIGQMDPPVIVERVKNYLKEGGHIFITTPRTKTPMTQVEYETDNYIRYPRAYLNQILESAGFEISSEGAVSLGIPGDSKGISLEYHIAKLSVPLRSEVRDETIYKERFVTQELFGLPTSEVLFPAIADLPADKRWVRKKVVEDLVPATEESDATRRLLIQMRILSISELEPQVSWASQMLTIKGYGPHNSGFDSFYGEKQRNLDSPNIYWHSIDAWDRLPSSEEIRIIESVPGARYDVFENGVFVDVRGRTLAQIKAIFDEVARRLPDHGEPVKELFEGMANALAISNQHFTVTRQLRNGEEYFGSREKYLKNLMAYLAEKNQTPTVGIVSLSQEIVDSGLEHKPDALKFVKDLFRRAMVSGKVVLLAKGDVFDEEIPIMEMIHEILVQKKDTVIFDGAELKVHPDFRLVFLLNKDEEKQLSSRTGAAFPSFDFPQTTKDIGSRIAQDLLDSGELSADEKQAVFDVDFGETLRDLINRHHRGAAVEAELANALSDVFLHLLKTSQSQRTFQKIISEYGLKVRSEVRSYWEDEEEKAERAAREERARERWAAIEHALKNIPFWMDEGNFKEVADAILETHGYFFYVDQVVMMWAAANSHRRSAEFMAYVDSQPELQPIKQKIIGEWNYKKTDSQARRGMTYTILADLEKHHKEIYEASSFTLPELLLFYNLTSGGNGDKSWYPIPNFGFQQAMGRIKKFFLDYGLNIDADYNYALIRDIVQARNKDDEAVVVFTLPENYGTGEREAMLWQRSLKTAQDRRSVAEISFGGSHFTGIKTAEEFLRRFVLSDKVILSRATKHMLAHEGVKKLLERYVEELPSMIETGNMPITKFAISIYAHAVGFNPYNKQDMQKLLEGVAQVEASLEYGKFIADMARETAAAALQIRAVRELGAELPGFEGAVSADQILQMLGQKKSPSQKLGERFTGDTAYPRKYLEFLAIIPQPRSEVRALSDVEKELAMQALENFCLKIEGLKGNPESLRQYINDIESDRWPILVEPERFLDSTPQQIAIFKLRKPLRFSPGIIYHGHPNADQVIASGVLEDPQGLGTARIPHYYAAQPFIPNATSPAIFVITANVFNEYLNQGKASLTLRAHSLEKGDVEVWSGFTAQVPIEKIHEIWVSEDTMERYRAIAREGNDSELHLKLLQLLSRNKIKVIPGLRLDLLNEMPRQEVSPHLIAVINSYLLQRDLLSAIPILELKPPQFSSKPRVDQTARPENRSEVRVQPIAPIMNKAVLVIEQATIDLMTATDFKKLLCLAGTRRSEIRLVIPDVVRGQYSNRVAALRSVATVDVRLPEMVRSGKIPVFGFSDMERDTAGAFKARLGRAEPKIVSHLQECFALDGMAGIVLALLVNRPEDLQMKNGFRYDGTGRFRSEVRAFVETLVQNYVVISKAA